MKRRDVFWTAAPWLDLAIVPAAATAKCTLRLRTSFVDVQGSAVEFPAIQFSDGAIRIRVSAHLDKSEPPRLPRVPVSDEVYALDRSVCLEQRSHRSFGGPKIEISDKNILHAFPFWLEIRESGQDRTRAVWAGLIRRCQIVKLFQSNTKLRIICALWANLWANLLAKGDSSRYRDPTVRL